MGVKSLVDSEDVVFDAAACQEAPLRLVQDLTNGGGNQAADNIGDDAVVRVADRDGSEFGRVGDLTSQ